jgi:hypothetical protein
MQTNWQEGDFDGKLCAVRNCDVSAIQTGRNGVAQFSIESASMIDPRLLISTYYYDIVNSFRTP